MKTTETSLWGKALSIISSALVILFVTRKWVEIGSGILSSISDYIQAKISISIFELYNLDMFGDDASFVFLILTVCAVVLILLSAINIILALKDLSAGKITTTISAVYSVIFVIAFVAGVCLVNMEIKDEMGIVGIGNVVKTTSMPYLTAIFSVVSCVGYRKSAAFETKRVASPRRSVLRCVNCGEAIGANDVFCNNCGSKVEREVFEEKEKFCNNCGAKITGDNAFCIHCGTRVR